MTQQQKQDKSYSFRFFFLVKRSEKDIFLNACRRFVEYENFQEDSSTIRLKTVAFDTEMKRVVKLKQNLCPFSKFARFNLSLRFPELSLRRRENTHYSNIYRDQRCLPTGCDMFA